MKKIGTLLLSGLLATAMVLPFVGCDGSNGGNGGGSGSLGGLTGGGNNQNKEFELPEGGFDLTKPVTISFYHTMGADLRDVLDRHIKEFQKLYPNITIEHQQTGSYEDVRDQIVTELSSNTGNQPNIAYCYPDHVALFNNSSAVLPLNDFLYDGKYKDATIKQGKLDENGDPVYQRDENDEIVYNSYDIPLVETVDAPLAMTEAEKDSFIQGYYQEGYKFGDESTMYTLPFSKSTEVLFYDETFFKANGLTPPTTWDEMWRVCDAIKEKDPNCIPLGYDSESNWFITMCEQYGSEYTSSEGNKYRFDNPTNRAFVQKLVEMHDEGYFTTQAIYGKYTSYLFKSTDGRRCYMCIGSSAGAKNQAPSASGTSYPFKVGITSIPQVNKDNPKVISQGPSICIFKNDDPQKVLASWLFAKYFTTNVAFQAQFSTASGYVPVLNLDTMKTNATYKETLDNATKDNPEIVNDNSYITALSALVCMQQENAYYTSPAFVGSSRARDEVGKLLQAVLTGSKTLDQAFKDAIDECEYFSPSGK